MNPWLAVESEPGERHVIPIGDTREHVASHNCWCKPDLEDGDEGEVWVHNSHDEREKYETGVRKFA
jgi:hypothetical protein